MPLPKSFGIAKGWALAPGQVNAALLPPPDPDPEPGDTSFTIPATGTADLDLTQLTKDIPSGNMPAVTHSASSPVALRYFG